MEDKTKAASIPKFKYSKSWRNPSDFPTYEPEETKVRDDLQVLHDEVATYINNTLIPDIETGQTQNDENADAKVSAHNVSPTSHQDIRDSIGTKIAEHNAAPTSHADIREAIAANASANAKTAADLSQHKADQNNPHGVTAAQAGADPSGTTTAADCFDEAASPTSAPTTWYVPKDLPRPSGEVGMMIDVRWQNGHMDGLGYDVSLVWGAPGGADNETIVGAANVVDALTGEYSIPAEGTVRYQLIEQSGRKRWQYVSGVLLPRQYSSATAADVPDKTVHGMEIEYLPGMDIYVQLDNGNTADVMRLVPANGPTLPVYGNGNGAKTGEIPAGYILHLVNAGDHWQIVNQAPPTKLAQLEGDANHRTVTDEQMRVWDSGGSEVADASAEKWATVKVEQNIPTITDMKTFEEFFYNKRKERARKYQFEWGQGGIHQNIYDVLGLPVHAPEDAQYFYYVEIPFSEAGGFIIHVTLEGRTNGVLAERKLYSTLNSRWSDTSWYQPAFITRVVIAPHGAGSKADMTASEIINAARKGVVLADYTDPKTGELRTYQYFKQMSDGRACFAINGYIEAGTPKQTLIYVDYAGNVTTETRDATAEGVGAIPKTEKGAASGVAALDGAGHLPALQNTPVIKATASPLAGWVDYFDGISFYKDHNGNILVSGALSYNGTLEAGYHTIATVPAGFKPNWSTFALTSTLSSPTSISRFVNITTKGQVIIEAVKTVSNPKVGFTTIYDEQKE